MAAAAPSLPDTHIRKQSDAFALTIHACHRDAAVPRTSRPVGEALGSGYCLSTACDSTVPMRPTVASPTISPRKKGSARWWALRPP
jgi:hypothetical protein